jgi:flagellar basal-body rod modification protein FlgD
MALEVSMADAAASLRTLEELNQRTPTNKLGQDAFLQILITQLANQNPLEPVSDTDFIAQLAQFSSLEQVQALNSSFATGQAYALTGKYVYVTAFSETGQPEMLYGKVDSVVKKDGVDYVVMGDKMYPASQVSGVLDSDIFEGAGEHSIFSSAALIGKTVTATYLDETGGAKTLNGTVDKIRIKDGMLYALAGGVEIPVSDIEEISL